MLVIETLACVAATFVGERASALFPQTLFRFRRSFAHSFSNKTRQLIRYLPNFHGSPCLPPPSPANFFFVFFISIILNFSLKAMQNVWGAQGAIWKMCIWSVNIV